MKQTKYNLIPSLLHDEIPPNQLQAMPNDSFPIAKPDRGQDFALNFRMRKNFTIHKLSDYGAWVSYQGVQTSRYALYQNDLGICIGIEFDKPGNPILLMPISNLKKHKDYYEFKETDDT